MTQYLTTPSGDFGPSLDVPTWRVQDGAYWTALWDTGGHPNGTNGNAGHLPVAHWAIRRWVSEVPGQIDVSGQVGCSDGFARNIVARVYIDGAQVYSYIVPSGQARQPYSFSAVVNLGSTVDFIFDSNGPDVDDMSYLTATITPEPASSLLILAVIILNLGVRGRINLT